MSNKSKGIVSLLLIGILFGLSGVIAKYLSSWLSPYQVVEYRFFVAFLGTILLALIQKQKLDLGGIKPQTLFWFAITFPVSVIFFTLAIFNTTVSLAVFSFYISTLITSFIVGKIYFKEDISKNKRIALVFMLLAVIAFTNPFEGFSIQLGFLFGIISGVFQTIASTFQKIVGKETNRISLLFLQTLSGTVIAGIAVILNKGQLFTQLASTPLLITVMFGIIFLAISYLFLVGFKYVNLNVGSILVSSELFFGPFFAFLLLVEKLTWLEVLGGLLTAVAVVLSNRD